MEVNCHRTEELQSKEVNTSVRKGKKTTHRTRTIVVAILHAKERRIREMLKIHKLSFRLKVENSKL